MVSRYRHLLGAHDVEAAKALENAVATSVIVRLDRQNEVGRPFCR